MILVSQSMMFKALEQLLEVDFKCNIGHLLVRPHNDSIKGAPEIIDQTSGNGSLGSK